MVCLVTDFYSSPEWSALKKKAYKRYGRRCQATGLTEKDGITLSVDHVKSRSKWPHLALKLSNVQILELGLNKTKSNRANWDWRPLHWRAWYGFIALAKRSLQVIALSLCLFGLIVIAYPSLDYRGFGEDVFSLLANLSWLLEIQHLLDTHKS